MKRNCKGVLLTLIPISGIYLHIPFCKQACNYCDFYFSTSLANRDQVVNAIVEEIKVRHTYLDNKALKSIYFGGGTPSLLSGDNLQILFGELSRYFSWDASAEITLEANPDDIAASHLKAWKNMGINRLSIGLQSYQQEELRWMNRAHTANESVDSVKMAQDHGFDNISVDLIYGSKFQDLNSWEQTLRKTIGLNTQHISSYNLTIEDKTVLGLKLQRGQEPQIDDSLSSRQFLLMLDVLSDAGFTGYEISNFGKQGFYAVHNTNYWLQQPYLGLGPSAHSFNGTSRQWNVKNNSIYTKALKEGTSFFEKEELSKEDRYNEYILTRLRTIWGCDENEIEKLFGAEMRKHFQQEVKHIHNFIVEKNGVITLNRDGKLQADGLSAGLFI